MPQFVDKISTWFVGFHYIFAKANNCNDFFIVKIISQERYWGIRMNFEEENSFIYREIQDLNEISLQKVIPWQKSHQFEWNVSKTEVCRLHLLPRNCSAKIWGFKRTGCKKRNLVLCFRRRVIQSVTEKGQNIQTESCTSGTRREDSWTDELIRSSP